MSPLTIADQYFPKLIKSKLSELHYPHNLEDLKKIIRFSAKMIFFSSALILIAYFLFSHQILSLFGKEFIKGTSALIILSAGQFINSASGSVGYFLVMTGYERDTVVGIGLSAALNVALNALLIPRWGIEGAAVATSSSMVLWNLLLAIRVYKRLGLDSTALGRISRWR